MAFTKKNKAQAECHTIEVTRARIINGKNGEFVVFDMTVNGVTIYGCNWVEGENEKGEYAFADFPSQKGKDGKYYHIAYVRLSDADNAEIKSQLGKLLQPE